MNESESRFKSATETGTLSPEQLREAQEATARLVENPEELTTKYAVEAEPSAPTAQQSEKIQDVKNRLEATKPVVEIKEAPLPIEATEASVTAEVREKQMADGEKLLSQIKVPKSEQAHILSEYKAGKLNIREAIIEKFNSQRRTDEKTGRNILAGTGLATVVGGVGAVFGTGVVVGTGVGAGILGLGLAGWAGVKAYQRWRHGRKIEDYNEVFPGAKLNTRSAYYRY